MKTVSIFLFLTCLIASQVALSQCNQSVNSTHYWGSNDGSEAVDLKLGLRKIGNGNNATCLESFKFITSYDFNNGTTYFKNRSHAWGTWHTWTKGSASGDLDIARLGGSLTENIFTMYNATNNIQKFKFNTNGVSFLNGGKVGIGTTSPDGILHVIGDPSANDASAFGSGGYIVVGSPTSTNIAIDNNEIMARNDNGVSGLLLQSDGGAVTIHGGSAPTSSRVHISGGGNVGLGTLSPANKLDIVDNSPSFRIRADVNNREIVIKPGDGNIEMADLVSTLHLNRWSPSPVAFAMGGGNVGIGTPLPTASLEIKRANPTIILNDSDPNDDLHPRIESKDKNILVFNGTDDVNNQAYRFYPVYSDVRNSDAVVEILGKENGGFNNKLSLTHNGNNGVVSTNEGNIVIRAANNNGQVGINTTNFPTDPLYKLAVNGKIISTELKVQNTANWPDYVFDENYELPTLSQLEQSIQQNGHLPGMPSAAEVQADGGVEVGDMQRRLLEKVEEMTLYIIQLEKRLKELEGKE